jgi:hypothetical protein
MNTCPVCQTQAEYVPLNDRNLRWRCERCGNFIITGTAVQLIDNRQASLDRNKLSDLISNRPRDSEGWTRIDEYNLDALTSAATTTS